MDLKFKTETEEFHVRVAAIIKKENKFLIMKVNDKEYYHIPGGHIETGENSKQALIREIKEELDLNLKEMQLFLTQENFWKTNNKNCHGIEFYYIIEPDDNLVVKNYKRIENDKGEEKLLEFKWVTAEELVNIDLRPNNIKELLIAEKYNDKLIHLIQRD